MDRFDSLLQESEELGISTVFLAGGEPLLRKDILEAAGNHRQTIFPFFTNGTLIDDQWIDFFQDQKNLIPIISLEGHREQTDERRGRGVYDRGCALWQNREWVRSQVHPCETIAR